MFTILQKHRTAALLGAALLAAPVALPFVSSVQHANAAQAPVLSGSTLNNSGSFAPIVSADKPAVVTVTTMMKAGAEDADQQEPASGDTPFEQQFRQFFGNQGLPFQNQPQQHASPQAEALGSGFILSADGMIVTNNHVIDGASSIKVTLDDGTELPATLVGADPKSDLAVIRVKSPKPLPNIAWGDSDKLTPGDQILAIGNPFGIGTTVTAGIVSARGRDLHSGPYDDFIQIDAPINRGNSGGPLVDLDGNVVGINTAIYSPNGGSVGVGFAIPSDQAQTVVAKLEKNGSIDHGFIGVQIQPVTADIAEAVGLTETSGALVAKVNAGSPAFKAGIRAGDVIAQLDGHAIKTPKDLSRLVADLSPGEKAELTLWRDGTKVETKITIGGDGSEQKQAALDNDGAQGKVDPASQRVPSIGLGIGNLTSEVRQALNLPDAQHGVLVESVKADQPASASGIQAGDIIAAVNDHPVNSVREARMAIAQAGKSGKKSVLLLIERDQDQTFIAVPFATS